MLLIELLATPHIRLDQQPLMGIVTAQSQALLIHLAVTQRASILQGGARMVARFVRPTNHTDT
ncbi:hypothetical protein C2W62_13480 [Candidatus Entotheonella serta]|nr:hypothetical protein C2W62_13480 [Candidatus Entotheonella serta]